MATQPSPAGDMFSSCRTPRSTDDTKNRPFLLVLLLAFAVLVTSDGSRDAALPAPLASDVLGTHAWPSGSSRYDIVMTLTGAHARGGGPSREILRVL